MSSYVGRRKLRSRKTAAMRVDVIEAVRKTRASYQRVTDLVLQRRRQEQVAVNGDTAVGLARMSPDELVENLHSALCWLQDAENRGRQARVLLERQIERETKELMR